MSTRSFAFEVAKSAAFLAGRRIRTATNTSALEQKSSFADIVTKTDQEIDFLIRNFLEHSCPDIYVRSEESGGQYRDREFIVDPIDGTLNFSHGYNEFAVSIGYWEQGIPVAGVVYDPIQERFYEAIEGGGAYVNGSKITVSSRYALNESLLGSGWPYDKQQVAIAGGIITRVAQVCQEVRLTGSSALALCKVAEGSLDGFWEKGLYPWDMAAAVLIIQEAGGKYTKMDGSSFDLERGDILATNGTIHEPLMERIKNGGEE